MQRASFLAFLALTLLPPAAAQAQSRQSCPTPQVNGFQVPHNPLRTGRETVFTPVTSGAARVEVTWSRGDVSSTPAGQSLRHTFHQTGVHEIVAVAVASCGARSGNARLRFRVHRPCRTVRDSSVFAADCDARRGWLRVGSGGVSTVATWESAPCRDVVHPPRYVPVARAAVCAAPTGPLPVNGRLPLRAGRRLTLNFRAPVGRVRLLLGVRGGVTHNLYGANRLDGSGRRWSLRLPRIPRNLTRVTITAARWGGVDQWVAGVR